MKKSYQKQECIPAYTSMTQPIIVSCTHDELKLPTSYSM
uniref:Uncharacterized protein n=1 Tax=Setaria italica TaxID=4555 RepID=K3YNV5_SETIT